MTTATKRRFGRTIRRARRNGYTKSDVFAARAEFEPIWERIREAAAPAIRSLIALIEAETSPRPQLIHNGRKPR